MINLHVNYYFMPVCRADVACRVLFQAKSKATLMLTGVINDDFHENIIWPDLPYVTDEHGSKSSP